MRKHWTIFAIGILVAVMPFTGFPGAWKTFFYVAFGLAVAVLIFLIIARERYVRSLPPHLYKKPRL